MKRLVLIIFIICFILTSNCFSQSNPTFVFDYDSTKIYLKYVDLKPFITPDNLALNDLGKLRTINDTIVLDRFFLYENQRIDSLSFDLDKELFACIKNKKGIIIFNGQIITSFYKKKVKHRDFPLLGRLTFKGYYYYDRATKKKFLTETIYQVWRCMMI